LGEHLVELAEGLAGVASDLEGLGRREDRDFELQAKQEIAKLIASIEGTC
jgi:hypothetical protein